MRGPSKQRMRPKQRTTEEAGRRAGRLTLSLAFLGLAVGCWLLPARAQDHGAPAANAPAHGAPAANTTAANAPASHTPAANGPAPETTSGVNGPVRDAEGDTHQGTAEPGPPHSGTQESPTHEVGQPPAHGGAPSTEGHAGGTQGEAAHGEGQAGHGEAHEEEGAAKLHMPTWIAGILEKIWYNGPATLTAEGAVDPETKQPLDVAALKGQQFSYDYEDHHFKGDPKPHYQIRPTIGEIGNTAWRPNVKTEQISVNGREVLFITPTVTFALQGMFPEGLVISLLTAITLALVATWLTRNMRLIPDRRQTLVEMIYGFLDDFVHGLIGPQYKRYVPLIGTAFLYILVMNLAGLIPGWMSPTANVNVTAGMAIVIIIYVQIEGLRVNGLKGYLMHFVGDPWWLGPLNFPLHLIGEVARVLSLSVRLFGNIFGEDVVIVILIILAGMFTKGIIPFQFPMYFLAIFTSLVQALVFCILSCVYIALMTTHEDHGHGHEDHGHHDDHGHMHDTASPAPAV